MARPPVAYTPFVVIDWELKKRPRQNAPTIAAPWPYWVPSDPDDAQLVATMLRRFGKGPPENQGEAEVGAACKRYGWTAVLDGEASYSAATGVAYRTSSASLRTGNIEKSKAARRLRC